MELVTDVGGGATFTAGDETMHDFDGDENYKDLTIQKQNRGKIAAAFNFQPTDY